MNQGWSYRDQVKAQSVGQTVLAYYVQQYPHSSQVEWQTRIETGQILLDQQPTEPETRLQKGQWLTYTRPPWQEPEVPLNFEILYADSDILVVSKPSGLPVLPGGGFLEHTLLWQLQCQFPHETPIPIHRLGRGTSGLMVLGRSHLARRQLSAQMRQHSVLLQQVEAGMDLAQLSFRKTYLAYISPGNYPDQFICTQPIGKLSYPHLGYVYGVCATGKPAYSACQVCERGPFGSLVEVTILTGRPHQIRIHLAASGYPLVGDPLYAIGGVPSTSVTAKKLVVPGDCGYWLHAAQLCFQHPRTEKTLRFDTPRPAGWPI
jgi:23S rRNA pseudouridine1911/1915/1917 synthase